MKQLLFTSILALLFINGFAQTATSFNVGGDIDKFYPVTFKDANWYLSKETEISIGRSETHLDSEWRGSLISSFKFHTFMYGNGSAYINAFIKSTQVFIAGWQDASGSNSSQEIIVWLKGGGTTYVLNSSASIGYTVYDGVQHALPFAEVNGYQHTYKTTQDSYVLPYQQYVDAGLLVEGNIQTKGRLGIGTPNPLNGLHIFSLNNPSGGSLRLGNSGSEDAVMSFGWNGVNQDAFKISKYAHNSTDNPMDLVTINSTNGNLGLGTNMPDQKLTIKGGIGFDFNSSDKKLYASDDGMLEWMTHDGAGQHGFAVSHQNEKRVLLNTNGNSYFLGGNVGIGTPNPTGGLEIFKGNVNQPALVLSSSGSGWGSGLVFKNTSSKTYGIYAGMDAKLHFSDNDTGADRVLIDNIGNVGIGTTAPSEKLTVSGKIKANEIRVDGAGAPDYVFEEGYKVATLEALESYIKTNKHLPEVPSAKEFERDGIAVGEMNKLLLKKIEELTLHLIDKDKALSKQQEMIDGQEQRLKIMEKEHAEFKKMLLQIQK